MEHRQLGRTGVSVSKFCLGAMMFGAWGNPDHDESIRIIHAALDAGINFIDTADVYGQGESEEIVGKALAGGRRDDVILATKFHNAMGEDPTSRATRAAGSSERSRTRCGGWAPTGSTSTRSTASTRGPTSRRRCRRSATSCIRARSATSASTFPASQIVEAHGSPRPPPPALRHRAAALLDARPRGRGRRVAHLLAPWHGGHVLQPADRRLAVGPLAQGRRAAASRAPAGCRALRPLPTRNQRKLDAVEELAQLADERASRSSSSRSRSCSTTRHHGRAHRPAHHGAARRPARGVDVSLTRPSSTGSTSRPPGTTINSADNSFKTRRSNRPCGDAKRGRRTAATLRFKEEGFSARLGYRRGRPERIPIWIPI